VNPHLVTQASIRRGASGADGAIRESLRASSLAAEFFLQGLPRLGRFEFMKILIVDDSSEMRQEIKGFLSEIAEQIEECSDGAQALAAYAEHRPAWVLMDLVMKETDGLAATREIKAAFPEARIIILTNYDDADLREAARSAGACHYVLKECLLDVPAIIVREEMQKRVP
jgi:DNA-binding NarL/FixJ family response regulator